jgi:ribonuclease D
VTDWTLVDDAGGLAAICASLAGTPVVGVDTEFERTRTFYARPALIQLSDGTRTWLVDPLAVGNLDALGTLLAAPDTVKVLHACSEDLEVLERSAGARPRPLFDTQIAAAFAGHGFSLGYRALVQDLLGIELDKGESRSDWLRRPLSVRQLEYAARDTVHLVPMYRLLHDSLELLGRSAWSTEECDRLLDEGGRAPPPESYYRRVRQARELDRRQLAALRELCAWRERTARDLDVARKHVADDAMLTEIARRAPRTRVELDDIQGVPRRLRERFGETVLGLIDAVLELPDARLPEPLSTIDPREASRATKHLRKLVRERADSLGMPPELLLQRRLAELLLEHVTGALSSDLPRELVGWRRAVIVDEALEVLAADA